MVEKIKQGTVEIKVWVIVLLVPIFATAFMTSSAIITANAKSNAKLELMAEINKSNIQKLEERKADLNVVLQMQTVMQSTLYRIETKLDDHIEKRP